MKRIGRSTVSGWSCSRKVHLTKRLKCGDDTAYYIVMCRDIKERMTEDDLWTETQQNTVISQAYSDAFEDMLDGWTGEQKVEKNDSAIKKYDAFKIDMDSSSQSA